MYTNTAKNKEPPIKLGMAFQGGGSYGAYTKGVLKALFNSQAFQSPDLSIKAITGTSAGAGTGALVTYALNTGGMAAVEGILDDFWNDIGKNGKLLGFLLSNGDYPNLSPLKINFALGFTPQGYVINHIKQQMQTFIPDWKAVQNGPVKLFVNAVREDIKTGTREHVVFENQKLTPDAIAASCALQDIGPHIYNGAHYYDGAYWRNPCMEDIKKEGITDLLIVTLQKKPDGAIVPRHQDDFRNNHDRPGHEVIGEEIHHHIAHIHENHPHINLHVISLDVDPRWDNTSRMNSSPRWLAELEKMGYDDGQEWLKKHAASLGKKSSYAPSAPAGPKP